MSTIAEVSRRSRESSGIRVLQAKLDQPDLTKSGEIITQEAIVIDQIRSVIPVFELVGN